MLTAKACYRCQTDLIRSCIVVLALTAEYIMLDASTSGSKLCQASGYCSLESQPSHYIGPLRSNLELRSALTALAYRKEIIITTDNRADPASQFIASFQKAGYGHVLLMTDSELLCKHLSTVFAKLGCGWHPGPTLYDDVISAMFSLTSQYPKLWLGARIIRLGYNVMLIDDDAVIMNDFYTHVKQPPFADVQLISGTEAGGVNGAFFYVQNASPNGPVAWAFANPLIRFARMVLQPEGIKRIGPPAAMCHEQDGMHDTVFSTIIGRPYFKKCIHSFDNKTFGQNWYRTWDDLVIKATHEVANDHIPRKNVVAEGTTREFVGRENYELLYANMEMPHIYGATAAKLGFQGWPASLGGSVFGHPFVPLAIRTLINKFLVEDIDSPLWSDMEDPSTVGAASLQPFESFVFAPDWLVRTNQDAGRFGYWNSKLTNHSKSVIGHIWTGLIPGHLNKRAFTVCSNLYDFHLSARLHGHSSRVYPGSHYSTGHMPPVLTYVHGLFNHTTSQQQFGKAIHDLGKIAIVSKHVIGWPGAPMAANWTHFSHNNSHGYGINNISHVVPYDYLDYTRFMTFSPADDLLELSGVWGPMLSQGCARLGEYDRFLSSHEDNIKFRTNSKANDTRENFQNGQPGKGAYLVRGLLPMDLKHFVSKLQYVGSIHGVHNTFVVPADSRKGADGVTIVSPAHVKKEALRMNTQSMVWIDRLIRVDELESEDTAAYKHLWTQCCAMQYDAMLTNTHSPNCGEYRSFEMARGS